MRTPGWLHRVGSPVFTAVLDVPAPGLRAVWHMVMLAAAIAGR